MIEVLKRPIESDYTSHVAYTRALEQYCDSLESQEPVAWMHIMDNTEGIKANGAGIVSITQKRKHPFGKVGIDFSKSYPVTSTPLYTHPPQEQQSCDKRTWQGLTHEQVDSWELPDCPTVFEFAQFIEAKLKQKNGFAEEKNT